MSIHPSNCCSLTGTTSKESRIIPALSYNGVSFPCLMCRVAEQAVIFIKHNIENHFLKSFPNYRNLLKELLYHFRNVPRYIAASRFVKEQKYTTICAQYNSFAVEFLPFQVLPGSYRYMYNLFITYCA